MSEQEEYVDKCPPRGVCTWCGHERCSDCGGGES